MLEAPQTKEMVSRIDGVRKLAHALDEYFRIPGTSYRFGLDGIIGLIPAAGDVITGLFSAYIVWQATRLGIPRSTLGLMILNILFDVLVGAIPVLGDIFDFQWKANKKNLTLLERHLAKKSQS